MEVVTRGVKVLLKRLLTAKCPITLVAFDECVILYLDQPRVATPTIIAADVYFYLLFFIILLLVIVMFCLS